MKVIEYFNKIEEFSEMENEKGFKAYEDLLQNLSKEDLLELIVEFTSVSARVEISLDILENPFDSFDETGKERALKLVH